MSLELERAEVDGGFAVLKFAGRLDTAAAEECRIQVDELVASGEDRVIGDFSDLKFISSAGLNLLIRLYRELKKSGGEFRIAGLQPQIRKVFEMTGYTKVFDLYETVDAARQ